MRQLLLRSSYGDTVLLQLIAANCDSAQFAALVQLLVKIIANFILKEYSGLYSNLALHLLLTLLRFTSTYKNRIQHLSTLAFGSNIIRSTGERKATR